MSKVRALDNQMSKWMMRHFYILFFEIVLVVVFFLLFVNVLKVIDIYQTASHGHTMERLSLLNTLNTSLIVLLFLLNSFWMLYVFNAILRIKALLRELNFNLSRRQQKS